MLAVLTEGPDDLEALADHIVTTVEAQQGQEDDVVLLLARLTNVPTPTRDGPWLP